MSKSGKMGRKRQARRLKLEMRAIRRDTGGAFGGVTKERRMVARLERRMT